LFIYFYFSRSSRVAKNEGKKKGGGTSGRGVRSISKTLFGKQDEKGA